MKKRVVILLLVCSFVLCIALPFGSKSYADPFTAGQIASTAYAMMQDWGLSFTAGSATAAGMNDFMSDQVQDYVNSKGGTIADVFVGKIAVDVAGKLVVGHTMYNSIKDFAGWMIEKFGLSSSDQTLSEGLADGVELPLTDESGTPTGLTITYGNERVWGDFGKYYATVDVKYNGRALCALGSSSYYDYAYRDYSVSMGSGTLTLSAHRYHGIYNSNTGKWTSVVDLGVASVSTTFNDIPITNTLKWNGSQYVQPTVLNPDKEWTGTIGGYSTPDTNLDQLLGNIDQAIADNNLVVDGEVIDVPVTPTPIPTVEPGDIDGYWNRQSEQLEGLGNDIGDISGHLDDIGDQIGDVTGAVEGVQQGIQTQTGVISGAMDQAAQDVVSAIGSQTAALDDSLTATAEGIQDITDILTAPEIDTPKFDLRELFPFCIPFDIYHLLQKFDGTPTAPHVQIPIVIPSIGFSYTLDLDFSAWDPVAAAMRTVELIVYALGLAWTTSKVIKW